MKAPTKSFKTRGVASAGTTSSKPEPIGPETKAPVAVRFTAACGWPSVQENVEGLSPY